MNGTTTGWTIFVAAAAMMLGLIAGEIRDLASWSQATSPAFVAELFAHAATVGAAFIGGRLIPTRPPSGRTLA